MTAIALHAEALAQTNLVSNGDFEAPPGKDALPPHWSTYVPEGTATIRIDQPGRDGGRCVRIETRSDLKATLVSEPIPVAPGEKLALTAWCRTEGVRSGMAGSLTFNAAFLDRRRHYIRWQKAQPAPPPPGDWHRLELEAVVPPGAAYASLQVGMAGVTGRTWWDDLELRAPGAVAARLDLDDPTLEPGPVQVPVVLINRDAQLAGRALQLRIAPGGSDVRHVLSAAAEQRLPVPARLNTRGKVKLRLEARDRDAVIAVASADVTVPPLLVTEPPVPTHWCLEDGPARLEGRFWVHEDRVAREKISAAITLGQPGKQIAQWTSDALPPNPVTFTLAPGSVEVGAYTLTCTLSRDGKTIGSSAGDWHVIRRADARVTLNAAGYPVVSGRPIFPIGMFNGGRFAEQASAGFNVAHSYNAAATVPGRVPDNTRLKRFLDETHTAGMKALVLLTHGSHARPIDDEVARRARMFRNHPGLLAWDEEEGIARGEAPLTLVRDIHAMIRRKDPNHPLMIGDARDVIFKIKDRSSLFPAEHMDLGMWWWYPFPITAGAGPALLEGEEVTGGTLELVPPTFLTRAETKKPLWVGVQAYRKPQRSDGRFPTPLEYRAQAYLAVIHGAKGLMYYVGSGSGGNGILNKPGEGHWDALKTLVTELRGMQDVFMAPDADPQPTCTPALISLRLKSLNGRRILLAVNRSAAQESVKMSIPATETGAVHVRFENRTLQLDRGCIVDRFDPYAVHVYDLPPSSQ